MSSIQPYPDLPGILEESCYVVDQFRSDTPHLGTTSHWALLDPGLEQWPYRDQLEYTHSMKNLQSFQQQIVELGNYANGYTNALPVQIPEQSFSRLGLDSPWASPDNFHRNTRYMSPNGYLGGSLSSTDSSPSECAFSPDLTRCHAGLVVRPQATYSTYPSPAADLAYTSHQGRWPQQQIYFGSVPHSPSPSSHTSACNLKDLQYNPDRVLEGDQLEESDNRVTIHSPEDILPFPESTSPVDSGLGMSADESVSMDGNGSEDDGARESDNDSEFNPNGVAKKMRRQFGRSPKRTRSIHATHLAVLDPKARISKNLSRKSNTTAPTKKSTTRKADADSNPKQFSCTFSYYGCDSKFASKNEWKRHVASQHLQLGFYRCDVGACNLDHHDNSHGNSASRGYNDFNRKDLFTQHHRRMHRPWGPAQNPTEQEKQEFEDSLEAVRARCWTVRREAPSRSSCGFCGLVFEDQPASSRGGVKSGEAKANSWDERMEHVGKHFEKMDWDVNAEREDEDLTSWAIREGIVRDWGHQGKWLTVMQPPPMATESVLPSTAGSKDGRRRSSRRNTQTKVEDEADEYDALHEEE